MKHIATIITCHNRKEKTISSLQHLYAAKERYDSTSEEKLDIVVYMTDDNCTDGTSEAVRNAFPDKEIHIQQHSIINQILSCQPTSGSNRSTKHQVHAD